MAKNFADSFSPNTEASLEISDTVVANTKNDLIQTILNENPEINVRDFITSFVEKLKLSNQELLLKKFEEFGLDKPSTIA